MKVEKKSEKAGLKLSIQKTKIMTSSSSTSWHIDGLTMEKVTYFTFLGCKITADGACSHEIKRCLFLGRKVMTNLDSILKSKDITLPTKVRIVQAMFFPVVVYGCESWTIKKTECRRIDTSFFLFFNFYFYFILLYNNCGVGEDSRESCGLQGDSISQS